MKKRKNEQLRAILNLSVYLLSILLATFLIINFVVRKASVIGVSMENTLMDGDQLLMDELSYRFNSPKRFDIVVFPQKYTYNKKLIKRIIGLPGERVYIDGDGNIFINDKLLVENYGKEEIKYAGTAVHEIALGKDEYFVLGDNRNESIDSRYEEVGYVKKDDLEGKIIFRLYPFNRMGMVK